MTDRRLPYDEAATPPDMTHDCQVVGRALPLGGAHPVTAPPAYAPSLLGTPQVSAELAARAGAMELPLV